MLKACPPPVDVQELQFKLHCRLKVFQNTELDSFQKPCSLVTCASRYGLLFVGTNSSNFEVIQLKCVENYTAKDKDITNYPKRSVNLPSTPRHLAVNCDHTILAVVVDIGSCPTVLFYDVLSMLQQNIRLIKEVRLSATPETQVYEINWNPAIPGIFTACKTDGSLGVYELKGTGVDINELQAFVGASCFCWSPKGKQIAVGTKDGKITQYKPDLKAVKVVNPPGLPTAHSVVSLQWISNFQFIGVYESSEGQASVLVVDAPKVGETTYTNYEDICYSSRSHRTQFYMSLMQQWNILMVASANGSEVGVLGNPGDFWSQWIMADSARAELPLSSDHQDTLPIGLALDTSSTKPLPWGESTIPPAPILLVLSHQGLLCLFDVVYLKPNAPSVCSPPDPISDLSGLQHFVAAPTTKQQVVVPSGPPPAQFSATVNTPKAAFSKSNDVTGSQALSFGTTSVTEQKFPTLFGGQATITPIKPQQQTSAPQSLFSGPTDVTLVKPKSTSGPPTTAPTTTAKYSAIFGALSTPPATVTAPTILNIPANPIRTAPQPQIQPVAPTQTHETRPQAHFSSITPEITAPPVKTESVELSQVETEKMLKHMIREECVSLESELKALLYQGSTLKIDLGSDEDKSSMVLNLDALEEFLKELVDISAGQNAEVHYLKQNLIQSWAWYEEALSRYNSSKDETMEILLRAQPLDSASEKHLSNIKLSMYYLESQLSQASKALDEQWDNFQDYAKKTHRTKMPTMEAIFQTMVRHNAILQKQRYVLKDIAIRLKAKGQTVSSGLLMDNRSNLIVDDFARLHLEPQDISKAQYERVLNRTKSLSHNKTQVLRDCLKSREVVHVSVIKPQLGTSILQQSPVSKSKQLISLLGAQMSPVGKPHIVKNLDFLQSTPKRDIQLTMPKTAEKLLITPILPNEQTAFLPVSKASVPAFSSFQGKTASNIPTQSFSAFVPTTQVITSSPGTTFGLSKAKSTVFPSSSAPSVAITPAGTAKTGSTSAVTSSTSAFNFGFSSSAGGVKFGATSAPVTTSTGATIKPAPLLFEPAVVTSAERTPPPSTVSFNFVSKPATPKDASSLVKQPFPFGFGFGAVSKPVSTSTVSSTSTASTIVFPKPVLPTNLSTTASKTPSELFSNNVPQSQPAATLGKITDSSVPANVTITSLPSIEIKPFIPGDDNGKPKTSFFGSGVSISQTTEAVTPTETTVSKSSIFASSNTIPRSSGSIFSNTVASTSTQPSFFGTKSIFATATSVPSSNTTTASTTVPLFGNWASTASSTVAPSETLSKPESPNVITTSPAISSPANLNASRPSIFSSTVISQTEESAPPSPATPSIFSGFAPPSSTTKPSIFSTGTSSPAPATTTAPSIFVGATTASTTMPSMFSGKTTTQTVSATTPSIFSSVTTSQTATTMPSMFSGASSITSSEITPSVTSSIFSGGGTSAFQTTASVPMFSTFGNVGSAQTSPTATTASLFSGFSGTPSTQIPSIFGSATTTPAATSVFNTVATTPASAAPSIFAAAATTPQTTTSIFANTVSKSAPSEIIGSTITQSSVFGSVPAGTSIFAVSSSAPTTQTTSGSLFGAKPTSTGGVFGSGFATTSPTNSAPFSQQSPSVFGTPTTTSAFGSPTPVFGGPGSFAPTTTANTSVFGQPAQFGAAAPVFGSPATSSASVFGAAPNSNAYGSSASVFGTPTSTAASPFGGVPSTSGGVFGAPASFSFASAASGQNTGGTGFGFDVLNLSTTTSASTASVFGGGSAFGQTSAANPFAKAGTQKSIFGETAAAAGPSSSTSIFGGGSSSTFGAPPQSFGSGSFGSSSSFIQQSNFGQSGFGNTSFGSPQPGPFSGGGSGVAQTGFGGFSKPSGTGFGGAPVFGGNPAASAFGGSPSFGGAPAFGAAPAFGSPNKVFGSTTPNGSFGAATNQPSPSFGNIANQNTVGFGSLAQQASTQANPAPFQGNPSFSSWR